MAEFSPSVPKAFYPQSERNKVKRHHERGRYDFATVHALLDAAVLCHIAYVIDGQPYCTPTIFWREENRLYWHGSTASRMLRHLGNGQRCCLTVTHFDALILARSAFHHSADYRSVMAFGTAQILTDETAKKAALSQMINRLYPQRAETLRPMLDKEVKATTVVVMEIEEASAKIRAAGVIDDEEDYALPLYAERLPLKNVIGEPEPCPRLLKNVTRPEILKGYRPGRLSEEALSEAYHLTYPTPDKNINNKD